MLGEEVLHRLYRDGATGAMNIGSENRYDNLGRVVDDDTRTIRARNRDRESLGRLLVSAKPRTR
jgi:hypothetical protein